MRTGRSTAIRGVLAASAAAGLVAALGSGSAASADAGTEAAAAPAKTISMRFDQRGPRFTGSSTVATGQQLRIRNLSDPKKIGPHTFTLVAANVMPRSAKAMKACFTPGKICLTGAMAHEFNEKTESVGLPLVEAGAPGWDKRFSRTVRKGDSWYTEKKDEEFSQPVSAKAGTLLRFMCLVHPEMQGKIKVTG
ncbi:MAG TPA: hypothetical protein VNT54_07150 [Solirubrobacteraceae bacterium]|nr:hypothetical protein [Solirubrobacteraceae bacterium]